MAKMKLKRVYDNDIALTLPLRNLDVYYTEDDRYKVMKSDLFGAFVMISIGCNPNKLTAPLKSVCDEILKELSVKNIEPCDFTCERKG